MNFYIQQTIQIQTIRIGGISNSSVFQIGSAGIIKPAAYLSNTGGFTGPAPQAQKPFSIPTPGEGGKLPLFETPAVPL
ncbi:spore gernimation protein [Neobacillus notoginsengisoli]|uniref:Spore gernimation protein n=1 Tax=Neobacillus notoginsengisoli TaxID=1578198 RepID=A0A417YZ75_9BACI|nr:spore germination protein GerPB [Neobacillus notoginsengisoli]RHW43165.1 spore gernimation protein [Neobacillus notoginsengisoli]